MKQPKLPERHKPYEGTSAKTRLEEEKYLSRWKRAKSSKTMFEKHADKSSDWAIDSNNRNGMLPDEPGVPFTGGSMSGKWGISKFKK